MSVELEMCNRFQGALARATCPSRTQHLARTSRLTCLHTLPQQSHIRPQWRLLFSLSLRLLSVGIAFNVLEGRSLTACPPSPSHSHPPAPQFTLRLNCSNFTLPLSRPTKSWTVSENPKSEADTVFQSAG